MLSCELFFIILSITFFDSFRPTLSYLYLSKKTSFQEEAIEVKKLFSIGSKTGEPLIVDIPDKELIAYCRDNFLFFQEYSGDASSVPKVKFSCSPLQIGSLSLFF